MELPQNISNSKKGTKNEYPISAYLYILVPEIAFRYIKGNRIFKGITIFHHVFLYSAYADDVTFFISDKGSVIEVTNAFDELSFFSGLVEPNKTKCETTGIDALKGVSLGAGN